MEDAFDVEIPPELEAGVYADRLSAWFTRHHVVLDFCAVAASDVSLATARVRVPASAALDVVRSLQECVRDYELQFGEIRRPRQRGEE